MGAICTVVVYPLLIGFLLYQIVFFDYESKNKVFSYSDIYTFKQPHEGIKLNGTGDPNLLFTVFVNDETFDNDDNPYG